MSNMYSVNICLSIEPSKNNFEKILNKGNGLKIKFLCRKDYCEYIEELNEYATTSEAAIKLAEDLKHPIQDIEYVSGLGCNFEDTYFILNVYETKDRLCCLSFFIITAYWYKYFNNEPYFDFGRYVKLLIDLCEDFPIVKIETNID